MNRLLHIVDMAHCHNYLKTHFLIVVASRKLRIRCVYCWIKKSRVQHVMVFFLFYYLFVLLFIISFSKFALFLSLCFLNKEVLLLVNVGVANATADKRKYLIVT